MGYVEEMVMSTSGNAIRARGDQYDARVYIIGQEKGEVGQDKAGKGSPKYGVARCGNMKNKYSVKAIGATRRVGKVIWDEIRRGNPMNGKTSYGNGRREKQNA